MTKVTLMLILVISRATTTLAQAPQAAAGPEERTISFLFHRDLLPIQEDAESFLQTMVIGGAFNSKTVQYTPAAGQTDRQLYVYCRWSMNSWGHYNDLSAITRNRLADYLNRKFKILRRTGVANTLYDDTNVWYAPLSASSQAYFAAGLVDTEDLRSGNYPASAMLTKGVSAGQYLLIRDDNFYGPDRFTLIRVDGDKKTRIAAGLIYAQDDAIKFALFDQMARAISNPVLYSQAPLED